MQKLVLIDGSSYFYRAFFGIRRLSTSKGLPTNAVFGFVTMLNKLVRQQKPDYVAMVFDAPGKTFRDAMYSEYKATREPMPEDLSIQIPYIKRLPDAYAIPKLEIPDVEADDVICTLARHAVARGIDAIIVTSDKDFMQVVDKELDSKKPGITLFDDMKDRRIGIKEVIEKFGVPPARVVDVLALMGDSVDNIPGVHGIGEKTAAKLVAKYGSLEEMYGRLDEMEVRYKEMLVKDRASAELSLKLARIRLNVPLPMDITDLKAGEPDREALAALFTELEFTKLLKDLGETDAPKPETLDYGKYRTILLKKDLEELIRDLQKRPVIAVDLETTGVDAMRCGIVGLSLCAEKGMSCYIPVGHVYLGAPAQLPVKEVLELLRPLLEDPKKKFIGQNIKYDALVLSRHGIDIPTLHFDTMVAAYLVNPDRGPHNLENICREYLDRGMIVFEDVAGKGAKQITFDQVLVETACTYCCEDSDVVVHLVPVLEERLRKDGLESLMRDMEMPLIPILLDMERTGVRVDPSVLKKMSGKFNGRMQGLIKGIHEGAGETFNIDSPRQLQHILFDKLGLQSGKKTKTGFSTDVSVLEKLAEEHALPAQILEYRQLAKLKSTYIDALPGMIHPVTGRVHTSYNQAVAATGRLSSSDPNLQNIPIRTGEGLLIRKAFVPDPGHVYVSADYSQIELRVMAHLSGDAKLISAFKRDQDIHAATAAEVFETEKVTDDHRRKAKEINFGIMYGMSATGLAQRMKIDFKAAQAIITRYFERYSGVRAFLDACLEQGRRVGFVTTLLGRRRYVPDLTSKNRMISSPAERIAVNAPIQGTAADLMKLAMIAVWRRLRKEKRKTRMILQVHDELVLEAPEAEASVALELLREEMERVYPMKVPLKVNVSQGSNWADLGA